MYVERQPEGEGVVESPDADVDEQVGDWLRRGDRLWIAPPRTPLPEKDEEPGDPWFYVGKMPEAYKPNVERRPRSTKVEP